MASLQGGGEQHEQWSPPPPLPPPPAKVAKDCDDDADTDKEPRTKTSNLRGEAKSYMFFFPPSLWSDFGIVLTHLHSAFHPFLPSSLFNQSIKTCFFKISISLYHHQSINQPTNQPCWPYKFIWILPLAPSINHYVSFFFFFFAAKLYNWPMRLVTMRRWTVFFPKTTKKKKKITHIILPPIFHFI